MEEGISTDIERVDVEREMKQSYLDYAMSVIIGRALPDVRDGLKPVQRRVLYAMLGEGLLSTRKTSKCAGVVGEVLKRLHPHGDSSVYDALVRLAQPWVLRYTLVDGQGNFGSIDGDPPAAYRYTECRMTAAAEALLDDIDKDAVDFVPNFDDSSTEPAVLPSAWPNLLVNGADGIAVGMATHIPPHNLGEVIEGAIALIKNHDITVDELMQYIPGPDFPTGGIIYGRSAIRKAYKEGRGILKVSAKYHIETLKGKNREQEAIVVTEIPFQVNKARLIKSIADLVNDKVIEGISHIRDESDRGGMRIVFELKRDATPSVVVNQLFKLTQLQSSFGVINLAIVAGRPMVLSLKEILDNFVGHRRDVVTRRTQFLLKKAQARMHILEGLCIVLMHIDEVVQIIKKAETPALARQGLSERFGLTDIQAQAVLDLRLQKLTGLERLAIEKEHDDLASEIARLSEILSSAHKVDEVVINELREVQEKFGDARRTEIQDAESEDYDDEDLIEAEDMCVVVSHKGYAKRTSVSEFRAQKRGGKGVSGAAAMEDDFVEHLFVASTHDVMLIFTTEGRLHWLKVYQIPEAGRTARGRALINLLNLREDEKIAAILPIANFEVGKSVVMATRQGFVKKVDLTEFSRPRKNGVIACTLNEGDRLIGVDVATESDDIVLATKTGMSIRFAEKEVRTTGRSSRGVTGIRLDEGDEAVGMTIVRPVDATTNEDSGELSLLTVCENGYGKRTLFSSYRTQGRAGKGLIDIQTCERNGSVVGVAAVDDKSGLMLITSSGKIIRMSVNGISVVGRNTKGVRLVNLDENEKVLAIALLSDEENSEENSEVSKLDDKTALVSDLSDDEDTGDKTIN